MSGGAQAPHYIAAQAAFEGAENADSGDVELQDMAEDAADAGEDALEQAEAQAHIYDQLPDRVRIHALEAALNEVENQQAAMLNRLRALEGVRVAQVDGEQNQFATIRQKQRRMVCLGSVLFGTLGVSVVAGGTLIGLQLASVMKTLKEQETAHKSSGGGGDGTTGGAEDDDDAKDVEEKMQTVAQTTIDEWAKLPNALLWDAIAREAFEGDPVWSLRTWAFVTRMLSKILKSMEASGRIADPGALAVDRAVVDADFVTWRDSNDLDARWIFDLSDRRVPSDSDNAGELQIRAARMDYLAQMFTRAEETLDDA
ncbi:hypothetical protein [Roseivivax sediminis]|uniref:Uncharacterized protein n=1 Tax=Roseivivax sediminis TaxID=936889 RepID=A0A1I1YRJ5_9RHOB|nr:hypothetical protein [Roseivivax sediminis]SFE20600.1 hypothetical protein SAMN04515678_107108 [Roseivivax sediminis]